MFATSGKYLLTMYESGDSGVYMILPRILIRDTVATLINEVYTLII
jgi:hypothetical protein